MLIHTKPKPIMKGWMTSMQRKAVTSMMLVAMVFALVGGATFAYFTDSAANNSNAFEAGTLDIGLDPAAATFSVPLMAPGDAIDGNLTVQNSGSLPFFFTIAAAKASGDDNFFNALKLQITNTASGDVIYDGMLNSLNTNSALAAGANQPLKFTVSLPATAGNELQGKTCNVAFTFVATQTAPNMIVNGGFESGDLTGWVTEYAADSVAVVGADAFTSPTEGSKMLRLGDSNDGGDQPIGDNKVSTIFTAAKPNLKFSYNIFTTDYSGFDKFEYSVTVQDAGGTIIDQYNQTAWGSGTELKNSGWKTVNFDLSGYVGQQLKLTINAGGTTDTAFSTWAYIDNVN
jgi:predicted ribosomally synthesized peptide with SipW-like signal peptide